MPLNSVRLDKSLLRNGRTGLTLVELLGGLAVGGVVLALAVRMFTVLSLSLIRLDDAASRDAERWNSVRQLAELLRRAAVPNDSQPFVGLRSSFTFDFHRVAEGAEPVAEHVGVNLDTAGNLVTRTRAASSLLRSRVEHFEVDYLISRGLESRWHESWVSVAELPSAVRLRLTRRASTKAIVDTILLAVGVRL